MRQSPFNALMSFVSEIAIEEKIPADARELDEFLRKPGKNYLEIKSGMMTPLSKETYLFFSRN